MIKHFGIWCRDCVKRKDQHINVHHDELNRLTISCFNCGKEEIVVYDQYPKISKREHNRIVAKAIN